MSTAATRGHHVTIRATEHPCRTGSTYTLRQPLNSRITPLGDAQIPGQNQVLYDRKTLAPATTEPHGNVQDMATGTIWQHREEQRKVTI